MKQMLFKQMIEAIERKQEKELEYLIAKQDADRLTEAYRNYDAAGRKQDDTCELLDNLGESAIDKTENNIEGVIL